METEMDGGAGGLTDSSGSTSRVRICSSPVITVTFISPPPVGIELAVTGERERKEVGGCGRGRLSRGGVHGVNQFWALAA